jgi:formylmethanofuran dehydrogenase subunit E-like metal-binding protein
MKMKKRVYFPAIAILVLSLLLPAGVSAATPLEEKISAAMETLKVSKADPHLLLLTNAAHVRVDGADALPLLDQAQTLTGCTVGKGNLLFFQRPQTHPLRMMLFVKPAGETVIISRTDKGWSSEALNLGPKTIGQAAFWEKKDAYKAGGDLFSLAAMANVWAQDGPYDFLKSAELHNHICPGLTSGYLIAHYLLDHYPLAEGERYTLIACPVWCKEDALQVVMDCTPGKKGLIVKRLSAEQRERISVAKPAGMALIWDDKKKKGKGIALSFDFDRIRALYPENTPKAAAVLAALPYLSEPDRFVSTAAEFELDEALYQGIIQAGGNPYALAGLVKP